MASIGDLSELQGKIKVEWKVKDFSSLSQEIDTRYQSPKFYFCGASWQIRIYPNGATHNKTNGWISLYVIRMSTGSTVKINYLLSAKTAKEKIGIDISGTNMEFHKYDHGWGSSKLISRSELLEKITNQTASDTLTITCTLKNSESCSVARSLFARHQALSDCLKEIYEMGKRTDCNLKVGRVNLRAHQMILEARSPVFGAMLNHDMKESQTGEIVIKDIRESQMKTILMHMYTGDIETPTVGNVFSLYAASEKYDLKEIKDICSDFIIGNLSDDWVLDVVKFNELYQNENIGNHARDYFKDNVRKILKTEKWKTFADENPETSIELLSSIVTVLVPE